MSKGRRVLGAFGGLRRVSAHAPLRVKLMAAMLVLSTVAVVGTSAAATAVLRSYLFNRVDGQLHRFTNNSMPYLTGTATADSSIFAPRTGTGTGTGTGTSTGTGSSDPARPFNRPRLSTQYFAVTRDVNGVEIRRESSQLDTPTAAPRLPAITIQQAKDRSGESFNVLAQNSKEPRWRVMVTPLADGSGSLTLALSLDDVDGTLSHLERILWGVGLAVLALTGLGAYLIVRTSLRPLRQVEITAEAIAGGDFSRRVPPNPVRTEVGRLSHAVNVMLGRIETSMQEREESAAAAQASEERMRRFVTDASHELRTPLTSIRGFAELYRQGAMSRPEQFPALMARIEGEAMRMGLLVEDLLLLARLDQQRPLEREAVDLVAIAGDTVMAARAAHPDRRVEVRMISPEEDPPGVIGDDARLRQIAGNLVTNACTHTPAGSGVRVGVGSVLDRNGRQWALPEVADDGPGLSAQECERVFERFYRTDTSRNRSTGGSGLGLSIVAALVAAHGGNVTVQSDPGAGAVFRVLLPVV
jgi:two-component system OmpR family sensor kinase